MESMRKSNQPTRPHIKVNFQSSQRAKVEESVSQNCQMQVPLFSGEMNEFNREIMEWSNFIIVYNPKSKAQCFFCGKCQLSFKRLIEFIYHCLGKCGQICHIESSHFIFDMCDWQRFLSKQTNIKTPKIQKSQPSTDESIKTGQSQSVQPESSIYSPSSVIFRQEKRKRTTFRKKIRQIQGAGKANQAILTKITEINQFTQKVISFWQQSGQKGVFIYEQSYYTIFGMVLLLNPLHKSEYNHVKECPSCQKTVFDPQTIKTRWFNVHFDERCSKINTLDSRFLILNAQGFYEYLFKQNQYGLQGKKKLDLSLLVYLYDKTHFREEINAWFPRFKYYRNFIRIFYHLFDGVMLSCPQCQYKISVHHRIKQCSNHYKVNEQYPKFTIDTHNKQIAKKISLYLYRQYLQTEVFYCPCQSFETEMTFDQFISHLKQRHSQDLLNVSIYASLK